ncbi:MAG: ATP-binding protein [Planctomycetota bacterium]
MSYRFVKRILGETNLERKCLILFGVCLFLLITVSFFWYGRQTEQVVYEQNRITGRLLVDRVLTQLHAEVAGQSDGIRGFLRDMFQGLGTQDHEAGYFSYALDRQPREQFNPRDEFEQRLHDYYAAKTPAEHPPAADRIVGNSFVYYEPIYARGQSCVTCHNANFGGGAAADVSGLFGGSGSTELKLDDLMAVARITISNEPIRERIAWNRAILFSTAIITSFLAMLASYAIVRYVIVKPLRHLRDVSDSISRGNISLRADLHTGDEFESLGAAFNRMLRHLVAIQEELRQANANLDSKVDELAQMNMRLYEMNTIKSDFMATMSHELRTPLNSILGFSEVLGSIDSLHEKQKRYVQNIQKSGRMLLDMINDILDLAKIESGRMDVRLTDFSVEQVVAAQCDMARPLSEKKNIDLDTLIEPNLPPMHQDQARVQQILNNLLSNAIKFTPEGGRIMVSVARDEHDFLAMRVSDTGVGIAEEDQQAIFEKFRQGRTGLPGGDAITREYSGTGLGLSIVKELCKLLGGEVGVQSELGKGSTFTVRLPWRLEDQLRLDSSLVEGFEEFSRSRFDLLRERHAESAPERG